MALLDALILGVLQGLTEFLPISSSAHLRIAGELFSFTGDPGATFTAIIQIGTELAVLIYFSQDIANILRQWGTSVIKGPTWWLSATVESRGYARIGWLIIVGTIPIAFLGYTAQHYVRETFRSLWVVAIVLVLFGLVLGLADRFGNSSKKLNSLSIPHGLLYGLAQALALIPGVSRSGATISMGRALGYDRSSAARYSFLLAVPSVFGSGFYELANALNQPEIYMPFSWAATILAAVTAFAVGLAVISWFMKYISNRSFLPFIIYRVALGVLIMLALTLGLIEPL